MPGSRQPWRNGMRRIADTDIIVRYLTGDDEQSSAKAADIISSGIEMLPETIPEVLYVLCSRTLYSIPRDAAAKAIIALLDDVSVEKKETIRQALMIYCESRLDYVDCLLIAEGLTADTEIISFDRKLMSELRRREGAIQPLP